MISLVDVCQGYGGCPPGFPLVGVIVDPPEASCVSYLLPSATIYDCIELGDVVPFGKLYAFGATPPGTVDMLVFEEP